MEKLVIVIPAYNEEKNIKKTIEDWYNVVSSIENAYLVVIDNNSTDRTLSIIKKEAESKKNLIPLTFKEAGHGPTILYGYHYALQLGADWVFQTDSDGQTVPSEFYNFWKQKHSFDFILGYRKNRQDGLLRKIVSFNLSFLCFLFFGIKLKDFNTPFRLMKASSLNEFLPLIPNNCCIPNVYISILYKYTQKRIKIQKITFMARNAGKNSINLIKIFRLGWKSLFNFYKFRKILRSL